MNYSNVNNNPIVIVPDITKTKIKAANEMNSVSVGLIIITVLLAHRAQISASLQKMDKQEIQQLPSVKWNAKQLAKAEQSRLFISRLVVAETINYQLEQFKNLPIDEAKARVDSIAKELSLTSPSPGIKIMSPQAITTNNLCSHRLALIARQIGIWQSRPIYDPALIIKNTSIITLNGNELGRLIVQMHQNFDIELNETFEITLKNSTSLEPYADALRAVIKEFFLDYEDDNKKITFDDAINLGYNDNKTPLESLFPSLYRTKPLDKIKTVNLSPEYLISPLFNHAVNINEKLIKDLKKTVPHSKSYGNQKVSIPKSNSKLRKNKKRLK